MLFETAVFIATATIMTGLSYYVCIWVGVSPSRQRREETPTSQHLPAILIAFMAALLLPIVVSFLLREFFGMEVREWHGIGKAIGIGIYAGYIIRRYGKITHDKHGEPPPTSPP